MEIVENIMITILKGGIFYLDEKTIENYYKYANRELDFNEQEDFNSINEKELDLRFFNLIRYINNKFVFKDSTHKIEIHKVPYSLAEIKIYFNNKLNLCKGKEKVIDWSSLITFLATGITILVSFVTIGSNLIKDSGDKIITSAACFIVVIIMSGILNYWVGKRKEKASNDIRIEFGFYELVLSILDEKIEN